MTEASHEVSGCVDRAFSDRAAAGERADECIPLMKERLAGVYAIARERVIGDDPAALQAEIIELADSHLGRPHPHQRRNGPLAARPNAAGDGRAARL